MANLYKYFYYFPLFPTFKHNVDKFCRRHYLLILKALKNYFFTKVRFETGMVNILFYKKSYIHWQYICIFAITAGKKWFL